MTLKQNILLIEDETFFQKFYVVALQEMSFVVDLARDGDEGIQMLKIKEYDCVLLDIIMPNKNGFEVLQFAKDNDIIPHIPIIMFSTLGGESDIQKALAMGAVDYANKAFFDIDTLLHKIDKATKKKKTASHK